MKDGRINNWMIGDIVGMIKENEEICGKGRSVGWQLTDPERRGYIIIFIVCAIGMSRLGRLPSVVVVALGSINNNRQHWHVSMVMVM
jgi:hypothetical protein